MNYRSISSLNTISKVLERCVLNHCYPQLTSFFYHLQHEFLKGRSTVTQLLQVYHDKWKTDRCYILRPIMMLYTQTICYCWNSRVMAFPVLINTSESLSSWGYLLQLAHRHLWRPTGIHPRAPYVPRLWQRSAWLPAEWLPNSSVHRWLEIIQDYRIFKCQSRSPTWLPTQMEPRLGSTIDS